MLPTTGQPIGTRFLAPEVLARISSLELIARSVVEGFIAGLHRSPYLGFSTDFAEHRPYMPGDDQLFRPARKLFRDFQFGWR